MEKALYESLLKSLKTGATTIDVDGLTVEVRNCEDRKEGLLDPRTAFGARHTRADFEKDKNAFDETLWPNIDHLYGPKDPENYDKLSLFRYSFGWVPVDLSTGTTTEELRIPGSRGDIPVWKYEVPSKKANRPAMVFFHGGGFFAGTIPTTEHQCKLLAELSGGVVFSVDYPLCPEHKFPEGFDACYEALEWVYTHAADYGIDKGKIGVFGDSAGGNLALVSTLRSRDEGKNMVAYLALIYPTVVRDMDKDGDTYFFDEKAYNNAENDPYIADQILEIAKSNEELNKWYLRGPGDMTNPYTSPILAQMAGLPKTLVMVAEYDFLRMECEEITRRMLAAGVDARHIRYGGIVHGTFDRLGYAPQVEDMIREIADDLKAL